MRYAHLDNYPIEVSNKIKGDVTMFIYLLPPILILVIVFTVILNAKKDLWYTNKLERILISKKKYKIAMVTLITKTTRKVKKRNARAYEHEDSLNYNRVNMGQGFNDTNSKLLYFVEFKGDINMEFEVNNQVFNSLLKNKSYEISYYKHMLFEFTEKQIEIDPYEL